MTPGTGTALLLLALFVLPGFVTLPIRERTYTVPGQREPFERLLSALYYAPVIYGFTLAVAAVLGVGKQELTDLYRGRRPLGELIAAGFVIGLLAPLVIAETGRRWRYSRLRIRLLGVLGISPGHDVESGWNQAFGSFDAAYVRVTTSDGRVVGGVFAKGSLAGYSEQARDLYLVQRWMLDDDHWFKAPADGTLGLWLPRESIASIEFYRLGPEPGQPRRENPPDRE